jgi:hypothetical protein
MDAALPKAAALYLFQVGPGLQISLDINNCSGLKPLTLALARADFNNFIKYSFGRLFKADSILSAVNTSLLRIKSITCLTLVGEIRKNLPSAFEIIVFSSEFGVRSPL